MIQKEIMIINKLGLHARAAAKLVGVTNGFASQIRTGSANSLVDAKSVMALMLLAASQGTVLTFEFDGGDEEQACEAVSQLIANRFDEIE